MRTDAAAGQGRAIAAMLTYSRSGRYGLKMLAAPRLTEQNSDMMRGQHDSPAGIPLHERRGTGAGGDALRWRLDHHITTVDGPWEGGASLLAPSKEGQARLCTAAHGQAVLQPPAGVPDS